MAEDANAVRRRQYKGCSIQGAAFRSNARCREQPRNHSAKGVKYRAQAVEWCVQRSTGWMQDVRGRVQAFDCTVRAADRKLHHVWSKLQDPEDIWRSVKCSFRGAACRIGIVHEKASRGFEPRSLDSESRVLTVTPRGQMLAANTCVCAAS